MTTLARIAATLRKRLAQEGGAVLVVVAVMFPVLIASVVIAIDLGTLFQARQQAQTAADAGALGAAQDVYNNEPSATATTDAKTLVQENDAGASNTTTTGQSDDPDAVQETVSQSVPLEFANLLGIHIGRVSATATASSDIADALGYFGSTDAADINDGSQTGDGWANFCGDDTGADPYDSNGTTDNDLGHTNVLTGQYQAADTGTDSASPPDPSSPDYSSEPSDDPGRCPPGANPNQHELDQWQVVHGGVDVAVNGAFPSPPGTTDQMVDLTGTCVEAGPYNYPRNANGVQYKSPKGNTSTYISEEQGGGKDYDGYCENNADGEIQDALATIPGQTYTVSFQFTENAGDGPNVKQMMALVTDTNLATLPPVADTNGNDCITASCTTSNDEYAYGTSYPLEQSTSAQSTAAGTAAWNNNSDWLYRNEYSYNGPTGTENWTPFTFTFEADKSTTYLGFASMDNCIPDWDTDNEPSPSGAAASALVPNGQSMTAAQWVQPTDTVNALDDRTSDAGTECFYGPALSDVTVTNNGVPVALSQ